MEIPRRKPTRILRDFSGIEGVCLSPKNRSWIGYSRSSDGAGILNLETGVITRFDGAYLGLQLNDGPTFSADGHYLTASGDVNTCIWEVDTGRRKRDWEGFRPVSWVSKSTTLVCGNYCDGTPYIALYDVESDTIVGRLKTDNSDWSDCTAIQCGRNFIIAAFEDGYLRWWHLNTLKFEGEIPLSGLHQPDYECCIHPDEQILAIWDGCQPRHVKLLEMTTFREMASLEEADLIAIRFSQTGYIMAAIKSYSVDFYKNELLSLIGHEWI